MVEKINSFGISRKKLSKINQKERVILTDVLIPQEVSCLYKGTRALIFPSFYEGAGLLLLETQSLEASVLTSNTSSLSEIDGNQFYMLILIIKKLSKAWKELLLMRN